MANANGCQRRSGSHRPSCVSLQSGSIRQSGGWRRLRNAEVGAPRLLAARDHLHRAGVAALAHVDAALDPPAALEQRVGELDVEVAGRERRDHAVEEVGRLVQRRARRPHLDGHARPACAAAPTTGLRARTAKPSRHLRARRSGRGLGRHRELEPRRARPRLDPARADRGREPPGRAHLDPQQGDVGGGPASPRSSPSDPAPGRRRARRQIELERAAGRGISVASQQGRPPAGTLRTVAETAPVRVMLG